jgi:hypothetical protein
MNLKWADEVGSGAFIVCQIIWMRFTAADISSRKKLCRVDAVNFERLSSSGDGVVALCCRPLDLTF